jgi:hypothetical protein
MKPDPSANRIFFRTESAATSVSDRCSDFSKLLDTTGQNRSWMGLVSRQG